MVKLNSYSTVYTVKIDLNTAGATTVEAEKAAWRMIHDSVIPTINRMNGVVGATIVDSGHSVAGAQEMTV